MQPHIVLTSINAKGLNIPEKRRILLGDLKRHRAQIAFVQETHFRSNNVPSLKNRDFPTVYHSTNPEAKTKGVSILIARTVPWTLIDSKIDTLGRYVILKGKLGQNTVTLVALYGPTSGQASFLRRILSILDSFSEGVQIIGGYFNFVPDPLMDSSKRVPGTPRPAYKQIGRLLNLSQLIDVWRLIHPTEKDYSFYSNPHGSYSHIDYFLLRHRDLPILKSATIGNITWSDHAPVSISVALLEDRPFVPGVWRLNESLLHDPSVKADVLRELDGFFATNATPEMDPLLVWEAHKPVIRGIFIKHGARIKKERASTLTALLGELESLERRHKLSPDPSVWAALTSVRLRIRSWHLFQAQASLSRCRKVFYETGDKCGRTLANALKKQRLQTYVPRISVGGGKFANLPKYIAAAFRGFYKSLYNLSAPGTGSPRVVTPAEMHEYKRLGCRDSLQKWLTC